MYVNHYRMYEFGHVSLLYYIDIFRVLISIEFHDYYIKLLIVFVIFSISQAIILRDLVLHLQLDFILIDI